MKALSIVVSDKTIFNFYFENVFKPMWPRYAIDQIHFNNYIKMGHMRSIPAKFIQKIS